MKDRSLLYISIFLIIAAILAIVLFSAKASIQKDVTTASMRNISTMLSASTVVNFVTKRSNPKKGMAITNCADVSNLLADDTLYRILDEPIESHSIHKCTLVGPNNLMIQFYEIGAK